MSILCVPDPPIRIRAVMMFLVHKRARDRAGAGVEVLVRAPHRKVDVPVVQRQLDVADGVREVPPDGGDAAGAGVGRDARDVEQLARVVLDPRQEEQGGGVGVGVDGGEDLVRGEVEGVRVRVDLDEGGGRGEVVPLDLGGDGVL